MKQQFLARLTEEAREALADSHGRNARAADLHDLLREVVECLRAQSP
jgi:hypothetical protein